MKKCMVIKTKIPFSLFRDFVKPLRSIGEHLKNSFTFLTYKIISYVILKFSEPMPSNQIIKVVMDPRKPLTVDNVLKMRPHEISSLYSSNSGAASLSSSAPRKKKKFSEPVKETLKIKIKKPFNIKNSLPSMPILVDLEANDSGIGKFAYLNFKFEI